MMKELNIRAGTSSIRWNLLNYHLMLFCNFSDIHLLKLQVHARWDMWLSDLHKYCATFAVPLSVFFSAPFHARTFAPP